MSEAHRQSSTATWPRLGRAQRSERLEKTERTTMKFFNTTGPCKPDIHYMLPASTRLPELRPLIDQQSYFVVHAPRQIGKTTMMLQLAQELVAEGRFNAVVVTAEPGRAFPNDTGAAELAMLDGWRADAVALPDELQPPPWPHFAATRQRVREPPLFGPFFIGKFL